MAPAPESEQPIQILKTVSNKQVEIFDRLRQVEERMDAIMERLRKWEVRTEALESAMKRNPSRL
jgi:hypothetical protein